MARELIVRIVGDPSSLEAALGRASAAADGFGGRMEAAGTKISAVGDKLTKGLTLPLVGVAAVGTKMAVDFQSSMELIHTQAGVSQQAVAGLSKSVLSMAGSVATTPETLSTGLYHLSSQGLRGAQAMDALRVAAEGAKVGQANLEDVTNALGAVLASGIKGSQNYTQAMGAMNATVGAGDMRMQDLADAMGTGLPAKAALAGVSLKDLSAALAVFGDNNIRGAKAGTDLGSAIRLMSAPSKAAAKELATIGLSATQLADDLRNRGMVAAVEDLRGHMQAAGLTADQQNLLIARAFGGKQATGISILVDQLERLKQKEKAVGDGASSFGDAWQSTTQTTAFKLDQMKASLEAAGISIGTALLPALTKIAKAVTELANAFSALPGPVQGLVIAGAAVAAAIGPVISVVGSLSTALGFLAANPIVLVIAAVALFAGAVAAAVLAPQQLQSALERMGLSAHSAGQVVADLREVFSVVESAAMALVNVVRQNWGTIKTIISVAVDDIRTVVTDVVHVVEALWGEFGSNIIAAAQNAWNLVKATVQNVLKVIEGVVEVFGGILHGNWSQIWNGIKDIVSGVFGEIVAILRYEVEQMANLADAIGKALWAGIKAGGDLVLGFMKKLPGLILAALSDFGSLLIDTGKALMDGLIKGIESGAHDVLDKIKSVGGSIVGAAKSILHVFSPSRDFIEIGQALMDGLAVGVAQNTPKAVKQLHDSLAKAKDAIDGEQGLIERAASVLGVKATEGIVNGALGVQQTAAQQLRGSLVQAIQQAQQQAAQALAQARSGFSSGFDQLANGILSAFDSKNSGFVSPAQKLLNKEQLQDQVKQYKDAISQAKTTLATDQKALTQALAGGDPTAIAAAHAQVISDQQAYAAAERQLQEFNLAQLAQKQDAAHATELAKEREALAKRLVTLRAELAKEPSQWDNVSKRVLGILEAYKVPLFQSGQEFASQFASGIKSQISTVEEAAKQLAQALAKYVPHSPAETGPLAFSATDAGHGFGSDFATGIATGLYSGAGFESVAGKLVGAVDTKTPVSAASGGVNVNVTVPVQGSLVGASPQQIADELKYPIRDALLTIARSEGRIFHGRA